MPMFTARYPIGEVCPKYQLSAKLRWARGRLKPGVPSAFGWSGENMDR